MPGILLGMRWIAVALGVGLAGLLVWYASGDRPPRASWKRGAPPAAPVAAARRTVSGPGFSVEGTVTGLGVPLAGVRVRVGGVEATTAASGAFSLAVAARERLEILVAATGYAPYRDFVLVPPGATRVEHAVDLAPGFPLQGHVVGNPQGGLVVRLYRSDPWGRRGPELVRTKTEVGGRFGWPALPPGRFLLEVEFGRGATVRQGVHSPVHGTVLVHAHRFAAVEGTVSPEATVVLTTTHGEARAAADAGGRYAMAQAPPGDIAGAVVHRPGKVACDSRRGDFVIPLLRIPPGEQVRLDLDIPPGSRLAGRVAGAAGTAVQLTLFRHDGDDWPEVATAAAAGGGAFAFDGVLPGTYTVTARSAFGAGRTTLDAPSGPITIDLRPTGVVEGRVTPWGPGPRGEEQVYLRAGAHAAGATLDGSGRFLIPGVPPCRDAVATYGDQQSEPFAVSAGRVNRTAIELGPRPLVRGIVLAPDGTPVPGAYVLIDYPTRYDFAGAKGWYGAITNREGRFELGFHSPYVLDEASREDWRLNVRAPGHPPVVLFELRVPTLEIPTVVEVRLNAGLALAGRVLDPSGDPAAGAEVRIGQWSFLHVAAADGQGAFRVPGLEDGPFSLFAVHPSGRYPLDEYGPAEFQRLPSDLVVRLQKVLAVAGRVVNDRGRPLGQVAVVLRRIEPRTHDPDMEKTLSGIDSRIRERYRARLEDIGSDKVGDDTTGGDGRFRIEKVPEGEYEIVLKPGRWAEAGLLRTVAGRVRSGREDLVLTPDLGAIVSGVVLGPDGEPVSGAHVIGVWDEPEGWSSAMAHTSYRPVARTDGAGRFRLTGLPRTPDLVAVARGLLPTLPDRVPEGSDLTIRLRRGLAIAGTLRRPDGTPFAGLDLKLRILDAQVRKRMQRIETVGGSGWFHAVGAERLARRTDTHGRFRFSGLFPGRYELLQDRPMVDKEDPILPRTVVEAGAAPLEVRTRAPLTVSGRVVDEQGKPVVRHGDTATSVNAYQAEGHKTWTGATAWNFVEIDGHFELGGLLPGEVRITVEAGDEYEPFEMKTSAGTRELRLVLKRKR